MLVPLSRSALEKLIPPIATGPQYTHYWGDWQNVLKQLLFSFVGIIIVWFVGKLFRMEGQGIFLILKIVVGFYWLWGPIYWASLRNGKMRRFSYGGFFRGRVIDVYITEEIISEQQSINKEGELVIIENRERRINVEIGDKTGFLANVQAPLRRIHKVINPGQVVELLVLSKQPDFSRINQISDIYIPRHNLWLGEYPYLRRDIFVEISDSIGGSKRRESRSRRRL